MTFYCSTLSSPVGRLLIVVDEEGRLVRCSFGEESSSRDVLQPDDERCAPVVRQLQEYFAGTRTSFDVELAMDGTEFQRRVWTALCEIPYGETTSYSAIAQAIGNERAVRAVGAANGANPIAIIVPCHRVIGRNGTLTGYAGGTDVKQKLLALEQKQMTLV